MSRRQESPNVETTETKRVTFRCSARSAEAVFLAGTFNDWRPDALPMARSQKGTWEVSVDIPFGRHEFKFVVDGDWVCEEGFASRRFDCPQCVLNSLGMVNRVLDVV